MKQLLFYFVLEFKKIYSKMLSKNVTFIAGGVGLALLGYCVYFDRKRRSHPDFRKNLIESIYLELERDHIILF